VWWFVIHFIFVRKHQTRSANEGLKAELHFDMKSLTDFHTYTIQNLSIAVEYDNPMMIAVWKEEAIATFICRDAACNKGWQILRKQNCYSTTSSSKDHTPYSSQ
jgi:hypothetical protein